MNVDSIVVLLVTIAVISSSAAELHVKGLCGDPGKPERSLLSSHQNVYNEDESVDYRCDDFISIVQSRKCVKGKWRGESAVCGKSFGNNDLKWAKVYEKNSNALIAEYNTSDLKPFTKFSNSFIAERYGRPLRAFGAKSYRFELSLAYKAIFHLARVSLSVVNLTIDGTISEFKITKVTVSPYRVCRLISHKVGDIGSWLQNSTRFDFWYNCESIDDSAYEMELKNKSNSVTIETESDAVLSLDLATFILTQPYLTDGNPREPLCGVPEVPTGLERSVIHHNSKYAFKCTKGFVDVEGKEGILATKSLVCSTDMKWRGSLPQCMPAKTCKKFELSDRHLTEVFLYERVYYFNDSIWRAIEGTKAYFRCKDETQIFVGKEIRVCGGDGEWSDTLPNCLATNADLKFQMTPVTIVLIVMLTLIVIFGLTAILVYCVLRMKRIRSQTEFNQTMRKSNIYDDYDIQGLEGKTIDETYEAVDDNRYADDRQFQRTVGAGYTTMMENVGTGFRYYGYDKNVYDDCQQHYRTADQSRPSDADDSYVVMKVH